MEYIFVGLYDFFQKRRRTFYLVFAIILLVVGGFASRIHIEEDISKVFPDDEKLKN